MRFPSLFRLPRNQQFEIKPRYYDPVKEFVEERKRLSEQGKSDEGYTASQIRFERKKSAVGMHASLVQLIVALLLASMVVGWLYFGNDVLYIGLIIIPFYLYLRLKRR